MSKSSKAPKTEPEYGYEAKVTQDGNPAIVTVRVEVTKDVPAAKAIDQVTRRSLRDEIFKRAGEFGLTGYGISEGRGYRAVVVDEADGSRTAVAYEKDFKFTRTL